MIYETNYGFAPEHKNLRRFNNFLTLIVIGFGIYLIIMPMLPQITFEYEKRTGKISDKIIYSDNNAPGTKPIPQDNRLVIPQMGLDAEIFESKDSSALKKGMWRRPKTSTPDKGGNTVIAGHRFLYKDPTSAIFYHLDKVKVGDEFALYWQGKEYKYKVETIKTVEPSQTEIEENTTDPILTLYTCTPLWTSKQRLVIISKPISGDFQ